jgi:hypothetical protein
MASRCDTCRRALQDPVSKAAGRGPVCRKKTGMVVVRVEKGSGPVRALSRRSAKPVDTQQLTLFAALAAVKE